MRPDRDRPAIVRMSALASAIASNSPSPTVRIPPLLASASRGSEGLWSDQQTVETYQFLEDLFVSAGLCD